MHRHKKSAADLLADGTHIGMIPDNILIGIEAVASAPSAYNRHPLRFYIGDDGTFSVRSSSPLELGIANLDCDSHQQISVLYNKEIAV